MKWHGMMVGLMAAASTVALGQQNPQRAPGASSPLVLSSAEFPLPASGLHLAMLDARQDQEQTTEPGHKHLSKKDKKALEHRRKEEEKRRKKEEEKERKEEAKRQKKILEQQRKQSAKERKKEMKQDNDRIAKEQRQERKEESREVRRVLDRQARAQRATYAAVTREALRAQRNVSRAIYSQVPNSNVAVLLRGSQIVLRGSAPTPSFRQRLLRLATLAAGPYAIVDELAATAVGSAAGAATSAAIGGVSDLIHGSGSGNSSAPPPSYSSQAMPPADVPPSGQPGPDSYPPPTSAGQPAPDASSGHPDNVATGLQPGSSACVNVSSATQVLLTGETNSQADADRLQQLAHRLAGPQAMLINQLVTRTDGVTPSAASTQPNSNSTSNSPAAATAGALTPASVVCVNADNRNELLLSGTVGSPSELASVEQAIGPLLGNARLVDQLTIGTLAGTQAPSPAGEGGGTTAAAPVSTQPGNATSASADLVPPSEAALEQALHSIPRLSNVDAELSATSVRLSGSVPTAQDDQVARTIAGQYASGRPVVDNLAISGQNDGLVR